MHKLFRVHPVDARKPAHLDGARARATEGQEDPRQGHLPGLDAEPVQTHPHPHQVLRRRRLGPQRRLPRFADRPTPLPRRVRQPNAAHPRGLTGAGYDVPGVHRVRIHQASRLLAVLDHHRPDIRALCLGVRHLQPAPRLCAGRALPVRLPARHGGRGRRVHPSRLAGGARSASDHQGLPVRRPDQEEIAREAGW